MKCNPENERIKRQYFTFLKEAKQQDESSIDGVAKAIARFEDYNKHKNFKLFHHQQAVGFKKMLGNFRNPVKGQPLSKATMNTTCRHLKNFFEWLSMQVGYKSRIDYSDAEYFNLSGKYTRIATATRHRPVPSLEQINHVLDAMPHGGAIERRNRAVVAFTLLTGIRDSALASIKIKHVDLIARSVEQDAREVKTKFSKTFTTFFFPVGEFANQIIDDWVAFLTDELGFLPDDPMFPKTEVRRGQSKTFEAVGLMPKHWCNANPVRKIFKQAFEGAGLPYYNPHSLRKTLVKLGERVCRTPEEFKAWSQNMGHEQVLTTFSAYGAVQIDRQGEIVKGFGLANDVVDGEMEVAQAWKVLQCKLGVK